MTRSQNTILRPLRQPRIRKETRGAPRVSKIGFTEAGSKMLPDDPDDTKTL